MAWALVATAVAQVAMMVVALITQPAIVPFEIVTISGLYIGLWLAAAFLWWSSSRR